MFDRPRSLNLSFRSTSRHQSDILRTGLREGRKELTSYDGTHVVWSIAVAWEVILHFDTLPKLAFEKVALQGKRVNVWFKEPTYDAWEGE